MTVPASILEQLRAAKLDLPPLPPGSVVRFDELLARQQLRLDALGLETRRDLAEVTADVRDLLAIIGALVE